MNIFRPFAYLAAIGFALSFALLPAALGDQVHKPMIDNPEGYVLTSDAGNSNPDYNRDAVQFGFIHGASSPGFNGGKVHYRYVYRLLDEAGDPVPVLNDEGAAGRTPTPAGPTPRTGTSFPTPASPPKCFHPTPPRSTRDHCTCKNRFVLQY